MIRTIFLIIGLIIFTGNLFSQEEYAKEIVKKMSSPAFYGRGYVNNGCQLASDYIENEFKKIGLSAFNNNYFQSFELSVNTFPGKLFLKINGTELKPGVDYYIDGSSPSLKGKFEVICFNWQNMIDSTSFYHRLNDLDDKIILLDVRFGNDAQKNDIDKVNRITQQLDLNKNLKHEATIILTNDKLYWRIFSFCSDKPVIFVNTRLKPDTIRFADINIQNKFYKNYKTSNMIGYIPGIEKPDSFIFIIAHYDHLGMMGNSVYFPGANDNASGTAMLLSLAKKIKEHPLSYTTVFISFGGEELAFQGSSYFTEHPLVDLKKIKFLFNFDIVGTGDEGIKVVNGSLYKEKFDSLVSLNTRLKLLPSIQIRGFACNSDQCMFYKKGVPCFYIYTLGGIKAYHDIYDKYETLPFTKFNELETLMIEYFTEIK